MTTTPKRDRYIISQLNGKFVITDSQRAGIVIVNDTVQPADNSDPAQMRFFGMDLATATALKDDLNAKYHY